MFNVFGFRTNSILHAAVLSRLLILSYRCIVEKHRDHGHFSVWSDETKPTDARLAV